MSAATMGMELFLAIALIGTALIMGIISISSYSEDRKTSAILTCLGASRDDIFSIYFYENLFISFLSLAISLVITPILAWTINKIVYHYTGFQKMVDIMIGGSFSNLLIASILSGLLVIIMCILFTYIPLFFSKKISPKEELLEE